MDSNSNTNTVDFTEKFKSLKVDQDKFKKKVNSQSSKVADDTTTVETTSQSETKTAFSRQSSLISSQKEDKDGKNQIPNQSHLYLLCFQEHSYEPPLIR